MMNEFLRWINAHDSLPANGEVIAFWVNYPRRILLFGEYRVTNGDGEFINYVDADRYDGPIGFKSSSGWVDYWCRFNDPYEHTK